MKTFLNIFNSLKESILVILFVFWIWITFIAFYKWFAHNNYKLLLIVLATDFIGLIITKIVKKIKYERIVR